MTFIPTLKTSRGGIIHDEDGQMYFVLPLKIAGEHRDIIQIIKIEERNNFLGK